VADSTSLGHGFHKIGANNESFVEGKVKYLTDEIIGKFS